MPVYDLKGLLLKKKFSSLFDGEFLYTVGTLPVPLMWRQGLEVLLEPWSTQKSKVTGPTKVLILLSDSWSPSRSSSLSSPMLISTRYFSNCGANTKFSVIAWNVNIGLVYTGHQFLSTIIALFWLILTLQTFAWLKQLAGVVAVEVTGGPEIPFHPGREVSGSLSLV